MQVWRQVTGYTFTRSVGAVCHIASVERMETSQTAQEIFSGHNFNQKVPRVVAIDPQTPFVGGNSNCSDTE